MLSESSTLIPAHHAMQSSQKKLALTIEFLKFMPRDVRFFEITYQYKFQILETCSLCRKVQVEVKVLELQ